VQISSIPFLIGALRTRMQVSSIGRECLIHNSLILKSARNIQLGEFVQIRRGVELDARSKKGIGISIGDKCRIKEYCTIAAYGGQISIGHNVLIGRNSTILGHGMVKVGDYSMLGPNVCIFSSEHVCGSDSGPFQNQGFTREVTIVGKNVWLGAGATILAGSEICDNVVIAAGSVVKSNIDEAGVYGGIPAKRISDLSLKSEFKKEIFLVDWALNE
jgi:acetyltransferase-like isoleucine patch superfamily enzyme